MVFKLLLCLSSPNFPSGFAVCFRRKTIIEVKFVVYYVMTKMGAIILPAKGDSDVMFCLQRYQGLRIDISLVH